MVTMRTWIEPVVAGAQVASSFYDTALLFVVKNYYNQTITSVNTSRSVTLQKAISNFYIIHNLILGLTPLLSAYILARIGDRQRRKVTICVPLLGYFLSRCFLLPVLFLSWPIEVMFGSAALNGLTGWFTTYWAGVMAWAALDSTKKRRSLKLITIELVYGLSGCVGSLASGHIFVSVTMTHNQGSPLVISSVSIYLICLLYSIFILKEPNNEPALQENSDDEEVPTERSRLIHSSSDKATHKQTNITTPFPKGTIFLLFLSATLYNSAVNGAEDVINFFVLKKPLSWGPVEVGYGNAAAYMIFITSFIGVCVFSKCLQDLSLVIFGMFSFFAGILVMAFVRRTYLYYIARIVMMFSLIPVPTIRAILSKATKESSYGKVFAMLQMIMGVVAVATSTAYIALYQVILEWFSGFIFILISIVAFISFIPIRTCKSNQGSGADRLAPPIALAAL
uniref:Thymic stromal cotransporter-like protein n=1 Tax=Pyxicephalus adspersus TaxID=30357 RepID=A0AAV3AUL9_PYXAD|nr:TPA: hypothetical protein GDO54_008615 [Pyxicephalus adspersus]